MSEEATVVVEDIKACSPPSTMNDLYAVADFCLIPIGTASTSVCYPIYPSFFFLQTPKVADEIAECQRILARSGLQYKVT